MVISHVQQVLQSALRHSMHTEINGIAGDINTLDYLSPYSYQGVCNVYSYMMKEKHLDIDEDEIISNLQNRFSLASGRLYDEQNVMYQILKKSDIFYSTKNGWMIIMTLIIGELLLTFKWASTDIEELIRIAT